MKIKFIPFLFFFCCTFFLEAQVPKNILIEDFRSAREGWSPDVKPYRDSILNSSPQVIWMSWHTMIFQDAMTIPQVQELETRMGISGVPMGAIDRHIYLNQGAQIVGRHFWYNNLQIRSLQQTSPLGLDISGVMVSQDSLAVRVTMNVTQNMTANDPRINLVIVEDSVVGSGSGYDQINFLNNMPGHEFFGVGSPIVGFVHRFVVRDIYPQNQDFGEPGILPASPSIGAYQANYRVALDPTWDRNQLRLVAFVNNYDTLNNNFEVINSNQVVLNNLTTEISSVEAPRFSIYPNPANAQLQINWEGEQVLYALRDISGRLLQDGSIQSGINRLATDGLESGLYILQFNTGNQLISRKVLVQH